MAISRFARRRIIAAFILLGLAVFVLGNYIPYSSRPRDEPTQQSTEQLALQALDQLEEKGRAPKTGYSRLQFGEGWSRVGDCDTRNIILLRDLTQTTISADCKVQRGLLDDPYTGESITFTRGPATSDKIQIDHVVALSDAWQSGAQQLPYVRRVALANDPLELLAVSGAQNQAKSDSNAASWLPPYKPFRCQYVARQIAIKQRYGLWVTPSEKQAMQRVLRACPAQRLPAK